MYIKLSYHLPQIYINMTLWLICYPKCTNEPGWFYDGLSSITMASWAFRALCFGLWCLPEVIPQGSWGLQPQDRTWSGVHRVFGAATGLKGGRQVYTGGARALAPQGPTIWDTGALESPSGPTIWVLGRLGQCLCFLLDDVFNVSMSAGRACWCCRAMTI